MPGYDLAEGSADRWKEGPLGDDANPAARRGRERSARDPSASASSTSAGPKDARPTLREVAEAAGVSPMTASRVLRGTGNVAPSRREAVETAVAELGYRSNPMAQALRNSTAPSKLVGFIVDDIKDPFFSHLARAVEDALSSSGAMLLLSSSDADSGRAADLVHGLVRRNVDALVIAPPPGEQSYLAEASRLGKPTLCVDRPAASSTVPAVLSDNTGGARAAVDHLVEHGHRRIAFIGDDLGYTMQCRLQGYEQALSAHGIGVRPELERLDAYTASNVPEIVRQLLALPDPPTALFTARNVTSLGALIGLHEMGVHEQVAQIGFDDVDFSTIVEPALTVVAQQLDDIGRRIAEQVLQEVDGMHPREGVTTVPVAVVERGSGELAGPFGAGRRKCSGPAADDRA
jgi:LacI family transcriptional regulator